MNFVIDSILFINKFVRLLPINIMFLLNFIFYWVFIFLIIIFALFLVKKNKISLSKRHQILKTAVRAYIKSLKLCYCIFLHHLFFTKKLFKLYICFSSYINLKILFIVKIIIWNLPKEHYKKSHYDLIILWI